MKKDDFVFDRFEILDKIAEGGMGAVYKAKHIKLDKIVALKVLKSLTKNDATFVRFHNEAKVLGKLNHPNIAIVYDFGLSDAQEPFIAFEFINGPSLDDWLRTNGPMSIDEALPMFRDIARALHHAHQKGIIHRDIKPGNVMIATDDGKTITKVVDFGIAKTISDETVGKLTRTGAMIGSPLYMSPEQSSGAKVTPQSDLYSVGCLMYACLTGHPPFRGETIFETMNMHQEAAPPDLTEALREDVRRQGLAGIVNRLLAKKPEERFESAERLALELYELSNQEHVQETAEQDEKLFRIEESENARSGKRALLMFSAIGGVAFTILAIILAIVIVPELNEKDEAPGSQLSDSSITKILASGNKIIELPYLNLTDDKLRPFQNASHVESLNLSGNPITDDGLRFLKGVPLRQLRLDNTSVMSLQSLPARATLQELSLRGTDVTDDSMGRLSQFNHLERLDVKSTGVTAEGIKRLSALPLVQVKYGDDTNPATAPPDLREAMPACRFNIDQSLLDEKSNELETKINSERRFADALAEIDRVSQSPAFKNDKRCQCEFYRLRAKCYLYLGKLQAARECYEKALEIGHEYKCKYQLAKVYTDYLAACLLLRDYGTARKLIEPAVEAKFAVEPGSGSRMQWLNESGNHAVRLQAKSLALAFFTKSLEECKRAVASDESENFDTHRIYAEIGVAATDESLPIEVAREKIEKGIAMLSEKQALFDLNWAYFLAIAFEKEHDLKRALAFANKRVLLLKEQGDKSGELKNAEEAQRLVLAGLKSGRKIAPASGQGN